MRSRKLLKLKYPSALSTLRNFPKIWGPSLIIALLFVALFLKYVGGALYEHKVPFILENSNQPLLVICLAGGKGRIEEALGLLAEGVSNQLFIVGAGKSSTATSIIKALTPEFKNTLPVTEKLWQQITVETESKNTIENAIAVSQYLKQMQPTQRLILVTSSYHMKRSILILQNILGHDIEIYPVVPKQEQLEKNTWYKSWKGINLTLNEYVKLVFARILLPLM